MIPYGVRTKGKGDYPAFEVHVSVVRSERLLLLFVTKVHPSGLFVSLLLLVELFATTVLFVLVLLPPVGGMFRWAMLGCLFLVWLFLGVTYSLPSA
jgi:hypothetical protein